MIRVRLLAATVAALLVPVLAPALASAARDATPEEAATFQNLTRAKQCTSAPRVSTVDATWATTGASPCEAASTRYVLSKQVGTWILAFVDDQSVVRACPVAGVPDKIAIDLNLCNPRIVPAGPTPAAPTPPAPVTTPAPAPGKPATPVPSATPTPAPAKPAPAPAAAPLPTGVVDTAAFQPGIDTSGLGAGPGRISLLCLPGGGNVRFGREHPSSCATLGARDSFAAAVNLSGLRWKNWGSGKATASGKERGFRASASNIKVKVTVSRKRENDCGGFSYTRLTAKSRFGTTRQTLPAKCSDDGSVSLCKVDSPSMDVGEWALAVDSRRNITCDEAKAVITECGNADAVPGWIVSSSSWGPVFTRADGASRFTTTGIGGAPRCHDAVMGF